MLVSSFRLRNVCYSFQGVYFDLVLRIIMIMKNVNIDFEISLFCFRVQLEFCMNLFLRNKLYVFNKLQSLYI